MSLSIPGDATQNITHSKGGILPINDATVKQLSLSVFL